MTNGFVKIISSIFVILFGFFAFALLYRLTNDKDPFVSLKYLLDYLKFFNGKEEMEDLLGILKNCYQSVVEIATDLPEFSNINLFENILDTLIYLCKLLFIPIEILVYVIFFALDFLDMLINLFEWIFGFLGYILAY